MTELNSETTSHLLDFPFDFVPGAAIFDCDGTLADTMPLHYRAWRAILDPLDCPFPEETFYDWGGVTSHEIVTRLNEIYGKTLDPVAVCHAKEADYQIRIPQVGPIVVIVAEVHRLHGKCPLAVASGGLRDLINQTLATLQLTGYFDAVVTAEDVTRGKPEPDTFLVAAQRLGVPAPECVVYEDSPSGLLAARRAGMRAVDVRPHL